MREEEVLEGQENLVEIRNSLRDIERQRVITQGLSTRLLAMLREIEEELATYDKKNIARREHLNQAQGRPEVARGRGEAALRRAADRGGPGPQHPQLRRGRRPPVPLGAEGGRRSASSSWSTPPRACSPTTSSTPSGGVSSPTTSACAPGQVAAGGEGRRLADAPRSRENRSSRSTSFDIRARPVLEGTDGVWLEAKDAVKLEQGHSGASSDCPHRRHEPVSRLRCGEGHESAPRQHPAPHRRPSHAR